MINPLACWLFLIFIGAYLMSKISLWKALQNLNLLALKLPLRLPSNRLILLYFSIIKIQGRILRFWKGVVLYVGHYDWSTKKILGFSWSKKAKIMLETISFWQNISVSIFKFSPLITADNPAINWYFLKFKNLQKPFHQLFFCKEILSRSLKLNGTLPNVNH